MRTLPEIKKELMQAIILEIGKHRYSLYDYSALDRAVGTALVEAADKKDVSEYIECRVCYTKNYLNNSNIIQEELPEYELRVLKSIDKVESKLGKINTDVAVDIVKPRHIKKTSDYNDKGFGTVKDDTCRWWKFW